MSDSDLEPGEYKAQAAKKRSMTPPRKSKSRSKSADSHHSKRSITPRHRSYSRSRSPRSRTPGSPRSRSRSYGKRSRSHDRYRSRSPHRSSHGRRSRSYEKRSYRKHSYSRSRSRSRGSRSPMSGRKRHIGDRMNPPSSKCLGIFGLSLYTNEHDLEDIFSRYGYIEKCNVVIDQKTGRSRGFGFVYFQKTDDAVEAKERANGMDLDGRKIRVDFSITKRAHTPTPGMYVGRPAPHYSSGPPRRFESRGGGGGGGYGGRYHGDRDRDYGDRGGRYERSSGGRYDDRERDRYSRRSPSPYYKRRSPSPYSRERRY